MALNLPTTQLSKFPLNLKAEVDALAPKIISGEIPFTFT